MPEESSKEPDRTGASRTDAHPPMPRDKRGWHVAPAPDGRGMPEQAPSGPPVHRRPSFSVVRAGPDRDQLAVGAVLHADRIGTAGADPLQPIVPRRCAGGPREVDLLQGQHGPGDIHDEGALSAHRHQGDADEAVRHRGSELLEQHPAVGPAEGKARRNQRQAHDDEPVPARRAAARLRSRRC